MKERDTEILKGFAEVLVFLAMVLVSWLVGAIVFGSLWVWFLVPLGAPPIGTAHALGMMVILDAVRGKADYPSEVRDRPMSDHIGLRANVLLRWLVLWGVGAIAHGLMA